MAKPETTPPVVTVATLSVPLSHEPLPTDTASVLVVPVHNPVAPLMVAVGFTVIVRVVVQLPIE